LIEVPAISLEASYIVSQNMAISSAGSDPYGNKSMLKLNPSIWGYEIAFELE
jgi:hypothetical protein